MHEISHQIFHHPNDLPTNWNTVAEQDVFLTREYLTAAFLAKPTNMDLYFVGIYKMQELIAVATFQNLFLKGNEILRERSGKCFLDKVRRLSVSPMKANLLILGNMLHTGEHAFIFDSTKIYENQLIDELRLAQKTIEKFSKKEKKRVHIELEKDFFDSNIILDQSQNYHQVTIQPNMILQLSEDWKQFQDYLAAMTTKYRTRCKRARKKLTGVTQRALSLEDLKQLQSRIHELYKYVSDGAGFNTFLLPENTFIELKHALKEKFHVFGLFDREKLIGFYTLIHNNETVEAYFLGYDAELQRDKQLYLNMLYNMIDYAIEHQFKTLVFARTAMEIKSSVGAEPHEMHILIRHKNSLLNRVFKPLFNSIQPTAEWVQRKPFKETQEKKKSPEQENPENKIVEKVT